MRMPPPGASLPDAVLPVPTRPLLLLDYDGTLAPIVDDPAAAIPHPELPALLAHLSARHPLVVISGRDLAALGRLLCDTRGAPVPVAAVGLHGAEEGILGGTVARSAFDAHAGALHALRAAVPTMAGVTVEDKGGAAFAVHYRRAPDPAAAHIALQRWAARAPLGLEPLWGKSVVEFRPSGISKGAAVSRAAAEHSGRTPVFVGDDATDEEAFHALNALDPAAVTVRVGPGATEARHRLPGVEAVVAYLRRFA